MLKKLAGAACAMFLMSSAASATVFHITGFTNHAANDFATSGFFLPQQGCDYNTCGEFVEIADGTAKGSWKTDTGKIRFEMGLVGGGIAKGNGWIDLENPSDGAVGQIALTISGSANGNDGTYDFLFRDYTYNEDAGVQGATPRRLALVGVDGTPKFAHEGGFKNGEMGLAMRANISAVPVPPALALMLAGMGGLGLVGARRKKKNA